MGFGISDCRKGRPAALLAGVALAAVALGSLAGHAAGKPPSPPRPQVQAPQSEIRNPQSEIHREALRFRSGLRQTRGIAISGESIYVAGDRMIAVHRADGTRARCVALGGAPVAVAVAPDGTLYAAMQDHVESYSAAGKLLARWGRAAARSWLTSIAVSGSRVWVGDAGQRRVLGYDLRGRLAEERGRRAPGGGPGLLAPSPHLDVAVSKDGALWVANPGRHRVEAYTREGALKRSWGKPGNGVEGFCGCCNPTDFALLPGGGFVTAEKGLRRVKLYDPSGRFQGVVAGPETFGEGRAGLDVAAGAGGRIVVLDRASGIIRVYQQGKDQRHGR